MPHLFWIIIGIVCLFAFRSHMDEHDARLQSDAQVKVAESNVNQLQVQIKSNDAAIVTLQNQMQNNDQRAALQVSALSSLITNVKTTPQATSAISQMTGQQIQPQARADG